MDVKAAPRSERDPPQKIAALGVEMPTGGGAVKGMGESFAANEFSGAATFSLPVYATPCRELTPQLGVDYASINGNGPFGLGFELSLLPVSRRTGHGVPRYRDDDVFVFSGGEPLVPGAGVAIERGGITFRVIRYRPRTEGAFERIELWRPQGKPADSFWSVTTTGDVTTLYGMSGASRISDPADAGRVFQWYPDLSYDAKGNAIRYSYKPENTDGVPAALFERNRVQTANRYLERIAYGNAKPYAPGAPLDELGWCFELVFDYGEYDVRPENDDPYVPVRTWPARLDAFSDYDAGFELRTHRLCRNILLFHRFAEIAAVPVLVQCGAFTYDEEPAMTHLVAARSIGYRYHAGAPSGQRYAVAELPQIRFSYAPFEPGGATFRPLETTSGDPLPGFTRPPLYGLVDLHGVGLPGIVYADGATVHYWEPQLGADGEIAYAPTSPQTFPLQRTVHGAASLADLDGDGQLDFVTTDPGGAGFYPNLEGEGFGPFVPFERFPTDFSDPLNAFADMTGDGRADVVRIGATGLRYVPSAGRHGYGDPQEPARSGDLPVSAAASPVELLGFANLIGSGGAHRVRVRDGVVECWPSYGYGRFGPKVTLAGAPRFGEQFDARRVRFVDVDGSGTADLAYIFPWRVEIYRNLSGNGFAEVPIVVRLPQQAAVPGQVDFADVTGCGSDALILSQYLPSMQHWAYEFTAATGKPYLLVGVDNGMGTQTAIRYASSTRFFLDDRRAGTPWATTVPFPVQVVAELEKCDAVSQTVSNASYRYHDGYYDPVEREFRGFGFVERWNTTRAYALEPDALDPARFTNAALVAPALTRMWFDTGAWERAPALEARFREQYFGGDPLAYAMPANVYTWQQPPGPRDERLARIALAGHVVRTETYGCDGSPAATIPYSTVAMNYTVRQLAAAEPYGVFVVEERESISYAYERVADDPHVSHDFVLRTDAFGNPELVAAVSYKRRADRPGAVPAQLVQYVTCAENAYVPPRDDAGVYLAGVPAEERTYEIVTDVQPDAGELYYSFAALAAAVDLALRGTAPVVPFARLLSWSRKIYAAEGGGVSPPGTIAAQALLLRSEEAAFSDALVRDVFAPTPVAGELGTILRENGGYVYEAANGLWWGTSETQTYGGADAFYLITSTTDPFVGGAATARSGTTSAYTYDPYWIALLSVTATPSTADVLPAISRVLELDYQTLVPRKTQDQNGTITEILQDPLRRVIVVSRYGTELGADGLPVRVGFMELAAAEPWPQPASVAELIADPGRFVRGAATFAYYDALAFERDGEPRCNVSVTPQEYPSAGAPLAPGGPVEISLTYTDGDARTVQDTVLVAPGQGITTDAQGRPVIGPDGKVVYGDLVQRWRTSGRARYNDKGELYRNYEPFFIGTYRFVTDAALTSFGVSPTMYYDALGRLVRVDEPRGAFEDAFFSRAVYGAWQQQSYDADDTICDSRYYRYYITEGHALPAAERDALVKAAAFFDTPVTSVLDTLGHAVQSAQLLDRRLPPLVTERAFDVAGNLLWCADPRLGAAGLRNIAMTYTLAGNALRTICADGGTSYDLLDIAGNGLLHVNARAIAVRPSYDSQQRVTSIGVTEAAKPNAPARIALRTIYGDSLDAAGATVFDLAGRNVCGQSAVDFDDAGCAQTLAYSIRGEPLAESHRLVASYETPPDWAGSAPNWPALFAELDPQLDAEVFAGTFSYDAMGRAIASVDSESNVWRERYDVSGLLAGVTLQCPGTAARAFVTGIDYNPRAERERVGYGDAQGATFLSTSYRYDPYDFRLRNLRTVRAGDGVVLQDLAYAYDPVGNPTSSTDAGAPVQRVVRGGQVVTPDRDFTYDALYRLIASSGRAHASFSAADLRSGSYAQFFPTGPHPNDTAAVENYTIAYGYDAGNNLRRLRYSGASSQWTQTLTVDDSSNRAVPSRDGMPAAIPPGAFDAAGNPLFLDGIPALAWDDRDSLASATLVQRDGTPSDAAFYTYNGSGQRARKTVRTVTDTHTRLDVTIYLGRLEIQRTLCDGALVEEYRRLRVMDDERCVAEWLRWTGTPPSGVSPDQVRYQLADLAGSSAVEVDEAGRLISYEEYAAYGGTTYAAGESLAEVSLKRYRFLGKERDATTGLSYFGGRYYAPWLGRWINPDPLGAVDGLNLYEFAGSNPMVFGDPLGYNKKKLKAAQTKANSQIQAAKKQASQDAAKWLGTSSTMYSNLRKIAKASRGGSAVARALATEIYDKMTNDKFFREQVARRVRVRAVKAGGAKKGYGKDELVQTSETAMVFGWAAGLISGAEPVSYFEGPNGHREEFDMLDIQEKLRLDTSVVFTMKGEGHTGNLRLTLSSTGYMTEGQADLHAERNAVFLHQNITSPAQVLTNVVAQHIHSTPNVALAKKSLKRGYTPDNMDLSKTSEKAIVVGRLAKVRDGMKLMLTDVQTHVYDSVTSSTPVGLTLVAPPSPRNTSYKLKSLPAAKKQKTLSGYLDVAMQDVSFANTKY